MNYLYYLKYLLPLALIPVALFLVKPKKQPTKIHIGSIINQVDMSVYVALGNYATHYIEKRGRMNRLKYAFLCRSFTQLGVDLAQAEVIEKDSTLTFRLPIPKPTSVEIEADSALVSRCFKTSSNGGKAKVELEDISTIKRQAKAFVSDVGIMATAKRNVERYFLSLTKSMNYTGCVEFQWVEKG